MAKGGAKVKLCTLYYVSFCWENCSVGYRNEWTAKITARAQAVCAQRASTVRGGGSCLGCCLIRTVEDLGLKPSSAWFHKHTIHM